jgi:hypothetical protein
MIGLSDETLAYIKQTFCCSKAHAIELAGVMANNKTAGDKIVSPAEPQASQIVGLKPTSKALEDKGSTLEIELSEANPQATAVETAQNTLKRDTEVEMAELEGELGSP